MGIGLSVPALMRSVATTHGDSNPVAGMSMNAWQTLVLNRVLDGMAGKLPNARWAVIGKCSLGMARRDVSDLLVSGVLGRLEGGRTSTVYFSIKMRL